MIFRDSNYTPIANDQNIEEYLMELKGFAKNLAPNEWQTKIDDACQNLSIVTIDTKTRKHKRTVDGKLLDMTLSAAAHKFRDNINNKESSCTQAIAIHPNGASPHILAHEALHAFSDEIGKNETGGNFVKSGAHFVQTDELDNVVINRGLDLNESITDALASRFNKKIGPGSGAGYSDNVIIADLLMGENPEKNDFIKNVYWGNGESFTQDFNNTIKSADIKFEDYYKSFKIVQSPNASELLKGALEYGLRKAKTPKELDDTHAFQQEVLDFYRDGGFKTNFIENEDLELLEKSRMFSNKIKEDCILAISSPEIEHNQENELKTDNPIAERISKLKQQINKSNGVSIDKEKYDLSKVDLSTLKLFKDQQKS